ncbi:DUF4012 domain-containing protein [Patescibacteria group bacterium]
MEKKRELKVEKKKKQKKEDFTIIHQPEEKKFFSSAFNKNYFGFIVMAVLVLFVFNLMQVGNRIFTIAGEASANAFTGYESFIEGGKDAVDSNFGGAVQYFESASFAFEKAKEEVWFLGTQTKIGAKETLADTAYALLEAGENLSDAASYFTQGMSGLSEIPIQFLENNALKDQEVSAKVSLTEKLKSSLNLFNLAYEDVQDAKNKISTAPDLILPSNIKDRLDQLIQVLGELQKRVPAVLSMLGDRYPHRYLILFQNNTESRPTGGFIGSFLIIDVNDGYITKADFHDIYDFDGQLNEHIPAPEEIAELTTNWRMRDSNFSPDFEVSAKQAAWFLEKEGGPGVDTVIAINQSLLGDLLSITGPIDIDGLDAQLDASNFNTVLTYIVESKLEGDTSPKKVLDRVMPKLQEKLTDEAYFKNIIAVIQKEIMRKNVLGWSKDDNIQHFFTEIGMSGNMTRLADDEDYFALSSINIGGNKSDMYLNTTITHETLIEKGGTINNIVTIEREHTWDPSVILKWRDQLAPFGYEDIPEWIQNILGRGNNKSVLKIYVPEGAKLVDALGVELADVKVGYEESVDKGYFYFTSEVAPQNTSRVTLTYQLPYNLDLEVADEYRLTVQKQPGLLNDVRFIKRLIADPRVVNYRTYPEEIMYDKGDVIKYETTLIGDQHFASLWGRE